MEALWSAMPCIPADVIFWIGPKLQTKGYRWAPSTFLTGRDLHNSSTSGAASLTRKGLRVRYPGWMLGCPKGRRVQAQFHIMDANETVYMVSCLDGVSRGYRTPELSLDHWSLEPTYIGKST